MACLRKADLSAIAPAQDFASGNASLCVLYSLLSPPRSNYYPHIFSRAYHFFHPVLDGVLIPDYPTRLITQGKFTRVPLMVGYTSNETLSGGTIESALKSYFPALTEQDLDDFVSLYEDQPISSGGDVFRTATGEPELRCAVGVLSSWKRSPETVN